MDGARMLNLFSALQAVCVFGVKSSTCPRDVLLPPSPSLMSSQVIVMSHFRFPHPLQPTEQPKHCYLLDPSCSVSDMKETKAGGRTLFYFELGWPSMSSKEDGEEEGEGESGRCV